MPADCKCIIILSSKSSGSSLLQSVISSDRHVKQLEVTRHNENETLFWVKAASLLNKPQLKMADSEVPIAANKARKDLRVLLEKNGVYKATALATDENLVFTGWQMLCQSHKPIFLEKSPHHLYQWSAIELILEAVEKFPEIDFYIIGLVRNPLDTLYSMWQNWRAYPEVTEKEWLCSYQNLRRLQSMVPDLVHLVRYEDLISQEQTLLDIFDFIGTEKRTNVEMHEESLQKWRNDPTFGFQLSKATIELAEYYGYEPEKLLNIGDNMWDVRRRVLRWQFKILSPLRRMLRRLLKR